MFTDNTEEMSDTPVTFDEVSYTHFSLRCPMIDHLMYCIITSNKSILNIGSIMCMQTSIARHTIFIVVVLRQTNFRQTFFVARLNYLSKYICDELPYDSNDDNCLISV